MRHRPARFLSFLRSITAAVLIAVVTVAALASTVTQAASVASGSFETAERAGKQASPPKPCQRAVLPGAANSCPLASFSLNSLPPDHSAAPAPVVDLRPLRWHVDRSRLAAQCGASSPYRPPRRLA